MKLIELVEDINPRVLEAFHELIAEVLLVKEAEGADAIVELVIYFTFHVSYDCLEPFGIKDRGGYKSSAPLCRSNALVDP